MAQAMARLSFYLLIIGILLATVEVGANSGDNKPQKKPKTVKCEKKKMHPQCYKKGPQQCPAGCPRSCKMDCITCTPYCKPKNVTCTKMPGIPACKPKTIHCEDNCPLTCNVDCKKCRSYCPKPPSPSPSPSPHPPPPTPSPLPPPTSSPPSSLPSLPPQNSSSPSPPPPPPQNSTSPPTTFPSPPPPSPPLVSAPKTAACHNKTYTHCYGQKLLCPSECPERCEVDCVTCKAVCNCNMRGAVCQDPRFIGGDGLTFYFHGRKDRDFCIVSDSNLHINAHFIGRRNANMKRDFTWVQSLGILFGTHKLFVGSMKTATWDDSVDRLSLAFDGEPIYLPEEEGNRWQQETSKRVTIIRSRETNSVVIEVEGNFKIKATVVPITEKDSRIHNYGVTQEDCFAHLDLSFKFYSLSGEVSGVLGQTYASNYVSRIKDVGATMPVLGGEREFASSSLLATDCAVARFVGGLPSEISLEKMEYGDLDCTIGLNGAGFVCKR